MDIYLFYFFACATLASSVAVVVNRNPVGSIIALVLTLFNTSVLYILLSAQFVAVVQILVYAGAIMVLFMFTVMFLILRDESLNFDAQNVPLKVSSALAVLFATAMIVQSVVIGKSSNQGVLANVPIAEDYGSVERVGTSIFIDYILPFELTSVLILIAIIGVIALSKRSAD
ncbi:MAG: NADH-quinone oxidoreductase subunit J [Candidatus Dadabacteria bacterium]|nr:NADH-quinone oxidoreductase subunit J [Candidatus Dadabacteria bacterium]NIS08651.1 NADH-quinone oxidoreductase subunit J [Candidatus Dadabacteria bacterium]NIV42485.1 NADH-quinone oxidoreductase subunit J [Candidatus Dadabacteria bacterium]NIX15367.1 NADH-quinone oxidoreductase subunit J [Candidatus Dadabacteria bacterium]NIY22026.1 NADH-quinone oxidoreductase subunit J [Candidatus Dadabacteria bacterium]